MKTQHMTTADIKRKWAEKLLSGETLTAEDREQIAYELGCTDMLEAAYRLLCRKLWFSVRPGSVLLTSKERDFLSKAFPPRKGVGRKHGPKDQTLESAMLYEVKRPSFDSDIECYRSIAQMLGMSSPDVAKKSVERGLQFVNAMEYDPINDDLVCNIQKRHDDAIIRNILTASAEELPEKN